MSDRVVDHELARDLMLDGYELDGDRSSCSRASRWRSRRATSRGHALARRRSARSPTTRTRWAVAQLLHEGHVRRRVPPRRLPQRRDRGDRPRGREQRLGPCGPDELLADRRSQRRRAALDRPEADHPGRARAQPGGDRARALGSACPRSSSSAYLDGKDDPIKILYDHMRSGTTTARQLARMYDGGRPLRARPRRPRARVPDDGVARRPHAALRLQEGRHDRGARRDLADHHMENMHLSATVSMPAGAGPIEINGETRLPADLRQGRPDRPACASSATTRTRTRRSSRQRGTTRPS